MKNLFAEVLMEKLDQMFFLQLKEARKTHHLWKDSAEFPWEVAITLQDIFNRVFQDIFRGLPMEEREVKYTSLYAKVFG